MGVSDTAHENQTRRHLTARQTKLAFRALQGRIWEVAELGGPSRVGNRGTFIDTFVILVSLYKMLSGLRNVPKSILEFMIIASNSNLLSLNMTLYKEAYTVFWEKRRQIFYILHSSSNVLLLSPVLSCSPPSLFMSSSASMEQDSMLAGIDL